MGHSCSLLSPRVAPFRELPGGLFRYQTNLESLDLGYCALETLPAGLFSGLWSLVRLDLRGNRLRALATGAFLDLWTLDSLLLSHNPIKSLTAGVSEPLGGGGEGGTRGWGE